jgi:hypothetical protein
MFVAGNDLIGKTLGIAPATYTVAPQGTWRAAYLAWINNVFNPAFVAAYGPLYPPDQSTITANLFSNPTYAAQLIKADSVKYNFVNYGGVVSIPAGLNKLYPTGAAGNDIFFACYAANNPTVTDVFDPTTNFVNVRFQQIRAAVLASNAPKSIPSIIAASVSSVTNTATGSNGQTAGGSGGGGAATPAAKPPFNWFGTLIGGTIGLVAGPVGVAAGAVIGNQKIKKPT